MSVTLSAVTLPAQAQLRVPALPVPGLPLQAVPDALNSLDSRSVERLSELRHLEIDRLIRANRRLVEADPHGEPIVRNEVLALSLTETALLRAESAGFSVDREQTMAGTEIRLTVLKAPSGMSTKKALQELRTLDPMGSYDFNHIYTGGGTVGGGAVSADVPAAPPTTRGRAPPRVGLLDSGIDATHPVFHDSIIHSWGCGNSPLPSAHGTAVASLLVAHADADIYAADVYCGRPTGGAVDTIVAALAWMMQEQVAVINVSLVGPKNLLLEQIVGALVARGYLVVAAVGNDGPTSPPLYPAAYTNVVGVTAVDSHRRVLIEAVRGPQVMFAADGADLTAASIDHAAAKVRGTSFAAPIVAALLAAGLATPDRTAAVAAIDALAKQAIDLGPPGRDLTYGFGLVGAAAGGPAGR
jgi:hypothetical protein